MTAPATQQARSATRHAHGSAAFIVESLLLLVFLVASLAIVAQLLIGSANAATQSLRLERAVTMAANVAERFAADPTSAALDITKDGLVATCEVTATPLPRGTMYDAHIVVTGYGSELYSITTARFVDGVSP